jgi:hypothetical protein
VIAMRRLALVVLLSACGDLPMPDAGSTPCGVDYPGLRVNTSCTGEIDVFIDGHEIPPTVRRMVVPGAVIWPWPDFARNLMPAYATNGTARVDFQVEISICQEVTLACP